MASMLIGDLEVVRHRKRASRSTTEFSRMAGAAFPVGFRYKEVRPGRFQIPVIWASKPVAFKLQPTQRSLGA